MAHVPDKGMTIPKLIGFFAGIVVVLVMWFLPTDVLVGLSDKGRRYFGFLLCAVIWWATKPIAPPYTALFLMTGTLTFNLAPVGTVAAFGSTSNFFMYFAAFIFVDVVEKTGLAKRLAYALSLTMVKSFRSMVLSAFLMTLILSFLIPHPFPRCFLVLAILKGIAQASGMNERDSSIVGFSVFAASVPISTITLTADGGLNINISALVGEASWMEWTMRMFLPGILAMIIFIVLFLVMLRPTGGDIKIDTTQVRADLQALGKMKRNEIMALFWTAVAVILWMTQPIHGIATHIIAICVICLMAMPWIGGIAKPVNFLSVEFSGLLYILAAFGVGRVSGSVGLDKWLANTVLPDAVPDSPYMLFLLIAGTTVFLHFFLGSCVSTANVMIPVFLAFTSPVVLSNGMGWDPICIGLCCYTALYLQWLFPFQSMNLMIGVEKGPINQTDIFKIGLPMTVLVFVVVLFEAFFWDVTGLLYVPVG